MELIIENFTLAGKNFRSNFDYEEAIEVLKKAMSLSMALGKEDAELYYQIGLVYQDQGKYHEAIMEFDKAIFIYNDSDEAPAYNMRGSAYHFFKEYDKALSDFSTAIQ